MRSAMLVLWVLIASAAGCRAPVPAVGADLPPCPRASGEEFPLYPGAVEDPSLAGGRAADAKYAFRVYVVAKPLQSVLDFYRKCLGRDPTSESEEGSRHYAGKTGTLTISGSPDRTLVRVSRTSP